MGCAGSVRLCSEISSSQGFNLFVHARAEALRPVDIKKVSTSLLQKELADNFGGVGLLFVLFVDFFFCCFGLVFWFFCVCFVFNGGRTRLLTDDHSGFQESLSLQWGVNN